MSTTEKKYPIGDLRVGATLDVAGELLRRNFWQYLKISLYLFLPLTFFYMIVVGYLNPKAIEYGGLVNLYNTLENPEAVNTGPEYMKKQIVIIVLSLIWFAIIAFLINPFMYGTLTRFSICQYLGKEESTWQSMRWSMKNYIDIMVTTLIEMIVNTITLGVTGFIAVIIAVIICSINPSLIFFGIVTASLFGLAGLFLSIYVYIKLSLYLPVVVFEKAGIIESFSRSISLTKNRFSRIFWIIVVINIIGIYLSLASNFLGNFVLSAFLVALTGSIAASYKTIVTAIVFFNCRSYHENLDLFILTKSVVNKAELEAATE